MDDLLSIAVSNAVAATVLALMAILVGAACRRPALVHGLWLLVLLKLVTPPLLFLPLSWPTTGELPPEEIASIREEPTIAPSAAVEEREAVVIVAAGGEQEPASGGRKPPDSSSGENQGADAPRSPMLLWPQLISIIWAVGALAWFFLALERLHRFRRLLRFARPASAALQERTRRLAQSLGLKRCPCVRLLPGRVAPMLWAVVGSPRLLVPADLLDLLNDEQLDTLLLHELAHLRRRDHWVRILEFVVMGLYWWHPVVWYARRELREAEEQCCDAWVVSTLPGTGRAYASALLDTLDFLSTAQAAVPPLASGLGQIADLKRRLTMIMRGNTPRSLTWPGCLAVIALGLTFLPMLPSLHGEPPSREEDASKAEVEAAEARLKEAQARFKEQKAMLRQATKKLRATEAMAGLLIKAAEMREYREKKKAAIAEGKAKATYRIEITLPADESAADVKDFVKKIREVLPEKLGDSRIHIHVIPARGALVLPGQLMPEQPGMPVQPGKLMPEQPGAPVYPGAGNSQDKRINDLEKKLEKVLHELHELRKQVQPYHQGFQGSTYAPPAPRPSGPLYDGRIPARP